MMRFLSVALLFIASLTALAEQAARPKLVLTVVIDQFRYDYLTRFRSHYSGGLAMLLEKGAVFTNANYEHFPTVTAIGHATILTGATPSVSGIVGNVWYEREERKQITCVADGATKLLGGAADAAGASPRRLLVSSLGDELKMSGQGESRVIGMSLKDRSAILPAGRMGDGAYWFDESAGNFVSSSYYFAELPAWVKEFNQSRFVDKFLGAEWTSTNPGTLFKKMGIAPGKDYYGSMERTPFGNDLLEAFAEAAIRGENLGRHSGVDLLSLSFSSNDYVGHESGPDSAEVRDISIRTDRVLKKLFDFVDSDFGMAGVVVVMTADHGVAPMPDTQAKRRMPGGRIPEKTVLDAVERKLAAVYGPGPWVIGHSGPAPYFNHDLIRRKKLVAADVERTAADAVRSIPHVFRVYTREQLMSGRVLDDLVDRRVRNGFFAPRASDLTIVAEPYWVFELTGTSHGAPFSYDAHVPLIFMGNGIKPGEYDRNVVVNDAAPTLATLLGVETPSGSSGRVLVEMLAR